QERGLENVLGVVLVAQEAAADAEHQRPVAAEERGEGPLAAAGGERVQELDVGGAVPGLLIDQLTDVAQNRLNVRHGRAPDSPEGDSATPLGSAGGRAKLSVIFRRSRESGRRGALPASRRFPREASRVGWFWPLTTECVARSRAYWPAPNAFD